MKEELKNIMKAFRVNLGRDLELEQLIEEAKLKEAWAPPIRLMEIVEKEFNDYEVPHKKSYVKHYIEALDYYSKKEKW